MVEGLTALNDLYNRVRVQVSKVDNAPGLIELTPQQVEGIAHVRGGRLPNTGEPAPIVISFDMIERETKGGTIRCSVQATAPQQAVEDRGAQDHPVVETGALIDVCEVRFPRPQGFTAKDEALYAEIMDFGPNGTAAFVSVTNTTKEFVHVKGISIEYLEKIQYTEQPQDLPPQATKTFVVDAPLQQPAAIFSNASLATARATTVPFGLAIKYQRGSKGEATLSRAEKLSLGELLGRLPLQ